MEKLVPKLRFPEFEGNFKKFKLIELSLNGFSNGAFNDPKKVGHGYRIINVKDMYIEGSINVNTLERVALDEKEFSKNRVKFGDVFFTRSSLVKEGIAYSNINLSKEEDLTYDGHLIKMSPNREICLPNFIYYNFKTFNSRKQFVVRGKTATMTTIGQEDIADVIVPLPSLPEQQKIASFLTSVDERLTLLAQQKEKLELYKKGVMQQIFAQKLRFKDEKGNNYPDWEEKKLGEIFNSFKGKGLSKDKITVNGKNKCILYGELYTTYPEVIKSISSFTDSTEGEVSKIGDILIPASTTTSGIDLANATALNENCVLLGGDITILRGKQKVSNEFYSYYLSNHKKIELAKYGQGTTIVHLYFSHFKNMKIDIPCLEEQQKIASFLSAIDVQIEGVSNKIEQTKLFKKGLLQQLFV